MYAQDETIGPLVRWIGPKMLELSASSVSDRVLEQHFKAFGAFCDANTSAIAVLVNLPSVMALPATQRRRIAQFKKRTRRHDRLYVAGYAFVSPSAVQRGYMTAVYWLSPPVYPHQFFSAREMGLVWLTEQLQLHPWRTSDGADADHAA